MLFTPLTVAASLLGLASAVSFNKRSTETTSLYGYGNNITGINVFFGDGLAYIGITTPNWLSVASNITFTEDPSSTTTAWTVNSNSSLWTAGDYKMYIIPTSGSFQQVGFVSSNGTTPTGAVTIGFNWYGSSVAYAASDSDWEQLFWAVGTNTTGCWKLMWNAGSSAVPTVSTPLTLKKTAPVAITASAPPAL